MSTQHQTGNPTVRPTKNFNSVEDVHALRAAMKGCGTDEKVLISIICRRSNEQLQVIQSDYKSQLGRDLEADVRSETSGRFRDVLCSLLLPRYKFYVKQLHAAMDGLGTNEDTLIEILCTLTPNERMVVQANYLKEHKRSLEDDLKSDTSGTFKRLLVCMCFVKRDAGPANEKQARTDAQDLINWSKGRTDADEFLFNRILTQRSFEHIRAINLCCEQFGKQDLEGLINQNFSGDLKNGLTAIVKFAANPVDFFASRLHKSMAGLGTTDTQLIRVMVMRSEIDLADVSVYFERVYGKTLASFITGDTSGNYRRALLTLLGEVTD